MIAIIDYGLGNLGSVQNALNKIGVRSVITSKEKQIQKASKIIFPGVGAAGEGMCNLERSGLDLVIKNQIDEEKPVLGICLGMQLLFSFSEENNTECLNIIPGSVKKLDINYKVPHVGWNTVQRSDSVGIFDAVSNNEYFYFVHSYYCTPENPNNVVGFTEYGINFCSVVQKKNIYGVQFHPEKSGSAGLQLLKNFADL